MTINNAEPGQEGYQLPTPVQSRHHVNQQPVKQSRDRAQYVRPQKGHSLILHLLFGGILLWIPSIYFAVSPNHYYHA